MMYQDFSYNEYLNYCTQFSAQVCQSEMKTKSVMKHVMFTVPTETLKNKTIINQSIWRKLFNIFPWFNLLIEMNYCSSLPAWNSEDRK